MGAGGINYQALILKSADCSRICESIINVQYYELSPVSRVIPKLRLLLCRFLLETEGKQVFGVMLMCCKPQPTAPAHRHVFAFQERVRSGDAGSFYELRFIVLERASAGLGVLLNTQGSFKG